MARRDQKIGLELLDFFTPVRPDVSPVSRHRVLFSVKPPVHWGHIGHMDRGEVSQIDYARYFIHATQSQSDPVQDER